MPANFKIWRVTIFLLILGIGLWAAGPAAQTSPEALEKRAKEAIEASYKSRMDLGKKFLPKPQALGSGWLLPWQLPQAMRKVASEEVYWRSLAGGFDKDNKAFMAAMTSLFLEFKPEEIKDFLDFWISMATKDISPGQIPEGYSPAQFALGTIILLLRWEFSPSLAQKMEMITAYLEEVQKIMAKVAEARFGAGGKAPFSSPTDVDKAMQELLLRPAKGLPEERLKQNVLTWAAAVKDVTAMTYGQCDNWAVLQALDEKTMKNAHFRQVVVALSVLDRNTMGQLVSDLTNTIWFSAAFFGFAHYFGGAPAGVPGALITGFLGALFAKCMLGSKGIMVPWFIQFCQNTVIYAFWAIGAVA